MLSDLTPIVIDMPAEDFKIIPLGDLHIGSKEFRQKEFEKAIAEIKDAPNTYVCIVGDCIDNGLKNSVTNVYEQTLMPSEQKERLYEYLLPIKDKIIGACGGNHERRSIKDADADPLYDVFCRLKIENRYRQRAAFILLRVNADKHSAVRGYKRPTYSICLTHGAGNGMYIGSSANKSEQFGGIIDGLDLLITGHTHKPITFPSSKLAIDFRNKQIIQKQFVCVTATSWLLYGGYPMEKMMKPTAFAPQEILFSSIGHKIRVIQ